MKVFVYQGKTASGKMVKGNVEAANEVEARVMLRAQRIVPLQVVEKRSASSPQSSKMNFGLLEPRVKAKELQIFTRQFATMINSGIPVVQCMEILSTQTANPVFKRILLKVKNNIESGKRLGDSLEGWPRVFNRLYISLVRAGEEGGVLDTILVRLAMYIEKSVKLKGQVVSALWYPIGVLIVAAIVIMGLLTFVIPKFESLFTKSGQQLPALTQLVLDLSHAMQQYFILFFLGFIGVIVGTAQYYSTQGGRETIDSILIQTPVFGTLIQKSAIARFSRTMSTMLGSGVGIIDSLDICSKVVGNAVVEKALLRAKNAISEGRSITQPLSKEPYIPVMVVQMIGVGEATGKLDTMMGKIADFYEEEVDYAVAALTSLMEPVLMVVLGGIIAVIVIAMYLPIFQLAGTQGGFK